MNYMIKHLTSGVAKLRIALANNKVSGLLITDREVAAILLYFDEQGNALGRVREFFENHPGDEFFSGEIIDIIDDEIIKLAEERAKK